MPNRALELVSRTATSITVKSVGLPSDAAGVNWYIGTSTDSMPFVTSWDGVYDGKTAAYTFSGLQPNTLYYIKFLPYDAYGGRLDPAYTDSFTTTANDRPANWEWESTVSSGSAMNMTAAEFNQFIDRIFAFAAYKGETLPGYASSYYVTAGTDMLASEVNAVRALISAMSPPTAPPSAASRSSAITAAFFNGLKNSLNSIT